MLNGKSSSVSLMQYSFTDPFSTAQAFVYASLFGALPPEKQKEFHWEESAVRESRRITGMLAMTDEDTDKKGTSSRVIQLIFDNGASINVFLEKQARKDSWCVVAVTYPIQDSREDQLVVLEPGHPRHGVSKRFIPESLYA